MGNVIRIAAEALFHPSDFFNTLLDEYSLREAFIFYCVLFIAIPLSIALLAVGAIAIFAGGAGFLTSPLILLFCAAYAVAGILGTFIATAVMHLFVMLFRGKGGYAGTFSVFVYSSAAAFLYQVLVCLFLLSVIFFKSFGLFLPVMIVILIGALWLIAIPVIGYKIIHKMGTIRAIVTFLFPPVLFVLIGLLINPSEVSKIKSMAEFFKPIKSGISRVMPKIMAVEKSILPKNNVSPSDPAPSSAKYYEENIKTSGARKELRFGGIVLGAKGYKAMVNENFVGAGDVIEGAKVVGVSKDEVKLVNEDGIEIVLRP